MKKMNTNKKVYVIALCDTGFGDQYSSLINAYNAIKKLKNIGYKPFLFISKEHRYFSLSRSLNEIYNLNQFYCEYEELRYDKILSELEGYKNVLSSSFLKIWVDIDNNDNFDFIWGGYSMYFLHHAEEPLINNKLIKKEILQISEEKFVRGRKDIVTLHYRTCDTLMNSSLEDVRNNSFWGEKFENAVKFVKKNIDSNVMVCSANRNVSEFFIENFNNTFRNEFTNKNLPLHNLYNSLSDDNDYEYLKHSKEILAEMISIKHSSKIYSINTFPSNFTYYGTINNLNFNNWHDKINFIHVNDSVYFD